MSEDPNISDSVRKKSVQQPSKSLTTEHIKAGFKQAEEKPFPQLSKS